MKYLEGERTEAVYWEGRAAELLELAGQRITREDFELVQSGVNPRTGEVLRPRQRHDLTRNGEVIGRSRTLYDAVVMAPKSASIVSMFDERVTEAHRQTVRTLTASIESYAAARVRRDHQEYNRISGNIIYGTWHHNISRKLDPTVHSHVAIVNLTYDPVEERWKALQALPIYQHRHRLTEHYREMMAARIERLGYQIRDRTDREYGWEIEGVSKSLMERFSQRSSERDWAISQFLKEEGREPSSREIVRLVRWHRERKELLPMEVLRERQLARLTPAERTALIDLRERALERQTIYEVVAPRPYAMEPQLQIAAAEKPEKEASRERGRIDLRDDVAHERPAHHEKWSYGETPSYKPGYKVRL